MNDPVSGEECQETIEGALLEDVPTCEYFLSGKGVPGVGTAVRLSSAEGRLQVVTEESLSVGFLSPKFDYLAECLRRRHRYLGQVRRAALHPVPVVEVDLWPRGRDDEISAAGSASGS